MLRSISGKPAAPTGSSRVPRRMVIARVFVLLTIFLGMSWNSAQAAPIGLSCLVVFGDSLSDQGNSADATKGLTPSGYWGYYYGRWTNGYNWVDWFENNLRPAYLVNDAYGGAAVLKDLNYGSGGSTVYRAPSLITQVGNFLAANPRTTLPCNTVVLWGGANDIFDAVKTANTSGDAGVQSAKTLGVNIANGIYAAARNLRDHGADHIIFIAVPDLSQTPWSRHDVTPNQAQWAHYVTEALNNGLRNVVSEMKSSTTVNFVDAATYLSSWVTGAYKSDLLDNVTTACQTAGGPAGLPVYVAKPCKQYLFFDYSHPTALGHCGLANFIASSIRDNYVIPSDLVQPDAVKAITACNEFFDADELIATGDLSNVDTGDFYAGFHIAPPPSGYSNPPPANPTIVGKQAVLNQRSTCGRGMFWDIRLINGRVAMETDDGQHYTNLVAPQAIDDGKPHAVVVTRLLGMLTIAIDGRVVASAASAAALRTLPTLNVRNDVCVGADGTQALANNALDDIVVAPLRESVSGVGLANTGAGDFTLTYAMSTQQAGVVDGLNQRSICNHGTFWDAREQDGSILMETDGSGGYTNLRTAERVNDGNVRFISLARVNGLLLIGINGKYAASAGSLASLGSLPPPAYRTDVCDPYGSAPLRGTLANIRYTRWSVPK